MTNSSSLTNHSALTEQPVPSKNSVMIVGSTAHTLQCATALAADQRFEIYGVMTPPAKPIGRTKTITPNPLDVWASKHNFPIVYVTKKIDESIHEQLNIWSKERGAPDIVLVVDFGYLIPAWMLEWPRLGALNVHPSALPRWRGSSPAQFVLLYGEKNSAVTLMEMSMGMDEGPIIYQVPLEVDPSWNMSTYYQKAFEKMSAQLPELIAKYALGQLVPAAQPLDSPTPVARRLSRDDGFVSWPLLRASLLAADPTDESTTPATSSPTNTSATLFANKSADESQAFSPGPTTSPASPLLLEACAHHSSWPKTLFHACKALDPWPGLWTLVPTANGSTRMKILKCELVGTANASKLQLLEVQLEGKLKTMWDVAQQQILGK